jgi:Fe-S-cluster containining protein
MQEAIEACRRDLARIVDAVLGATAPCEGGFALLMERLERRVAAALEARAPVAPPACGPGCAACCTVNVATVAVEGAAAAAFLRRNLGREEARACADGLLEFHRRVRWLEDGERIRERLACPFLDARRACSIHPVRPLACRGVTSLDPGECRAALDERSSGEGDGEVRMDLLRRALYEEAARALAGALAGRGLDARPRDVSGMVGAFLADPGLAAAFGAGARVPLE